MNHIESIELGLHEKNPYNEIIRKVFLTYPTYAFKNNEERQYAILNDISCHFNVPIMSVQVAGSAKTGRSFHKNRDFISGKSDLDIAIIDSDLFMHYMESVFTITKGYSAREKFPRKNSVSTIDEYRSYLTRGIFRPDLMPTSNERANWHSFFGTLSTKNSDLFKSINAGIYMTQTFFESKQRSTIKEHINNKAI